MFYTFSSIRYNLYEEVFLFSISFSYLYSSCVHFSNLSSLQDPNACFHESRYKNIKLLHIHPDTIYGFLRKKLRIFFLSKMNGYLWQGSWIPPETMTVSNLPNISSLAARLLCSTFSLYTTGRSL